MQPAPPPLPEEWHPADAMMLPRNQRGINEAWTSHGQFIKAAGAKERFIEPAVSRMFQTLHVPHLPVRYAHRAGLHLLHSEFVPLKPLNAFDPTNLARVTPATAQHVLLGEFLAAADDRHGQNYGWHPKHGLVTLDHGYSLGHNPDDFAHADPTKSVLWTLARLHLGLKPTDKVNPHSIAHALANRDELIQHARVGAGAEAAEGVARRLDVLRPGVRWKDLVDFIDAEKVAGAAPHLSPHMQAAHDTIRALREGADS